MKLDRRVRTSLISICTDILLISIKGVTAFLTGSFAILADALHSFSDLIVSCTVLTSILLRKLRERKAGVTLQESTSTPETEKKQAVPGYWIESLVALFVSLVILYTAYGIVSKVMAAPADQIRNLWIGVIGVTLCIGIAYFISRFKIMVGRETDSPALVADGFHSRMDMFTSIAVVLSIMGQGIGIPLDRIVAVVIAVLVAMIGLNLFISSIVGFSRKSQIRIKESWDAVFSVLDAIVGFLSQRLLSKRLALPRIDLTKLHVKAWFSRRTTAGMAILLLFIWVASGVRVIRPGEIGVRFRFGAIVNEHLDPGLHYALPRPFEKIIRVNANRVYRVEVGFRTDPSVLSSTSALLWEAKHQTEGYQKMYEESVAIAGDESLVDVSLVVHYRPTDAVVHLFRVNQIDKVMRGLVESYMRETLATERSGLMMTREKARVLGRLKEMMNREVDRLGLGVEVLAIYCHDLHPPLVSVSAFRDVFSAREDKARLINEAESHRNMALPKARAESETKLADAMAYEIEKKLRAEGDAEKFLLTADAYEHAPNVTGYRLFLETVEQGMAKRKKYICNPKANLGGYRLWLFTPGAPPGGF
jgi:membrane protease subunit HflK